MLADEYNKRVVIVDTSNEIGGDGDIPHPGIGRARRMQVPSPEFQHHVSSYPLFAALQVSDSFTCSTLDFGKRNGICSLGAIQTQVSLASFAKWLGYQILKVKTPSEVLKAGSGCALILFPVTRPARSSPVSAQLLIAILS